MEYGLLEYSTKNIGDEIQSLAAKQFLPEVDVYLERDSLNQADVNEETKIILNGWFTHSPKNWPPSNNLDPLIISFHISESASESLLRPESIEYFKKHEPIGCRDLHTKQLLVDNGVDAYFSGCLTLTLSHEDQDENSGEVLLVDLDKKVENALPADLTKNSQTMSHIHEDTITNIKSNVSNNIPKKIHHVSKTIGVPSVYYGILDGIDQYLNDSETNRSLKFTKAQQYLGKYAKAELVITSRLHVTLPCLAFGTPVVLVHEDPDDPRFSGLNEYMNIVARDVIITSNEDIDFQNVENPKSIKPIREKLRNSVNDFINDR